MTKKYKIGGMSCAACAARVEGAVKKLPGVSSCAVSLLTNAMTVEGEASEEAVEAAVRAAGYTASPAGKERAPEREEDEGKKVLLYRLLPSVVLTLALLYVSMGARMWGFPLPAAFAASPAARGLWQLLLAGAVAVLNGKFFVSGGKGVLHRAPNMDTLVSLGAGTSLVYGTVTLFRMILSPEAAGELEAELCFESAAMILTLITVGKMLEAHAKGKTTSAVRALADLSPKTASVRRGDAVKTVPAAEVVQKDVFLLRAGDRVPADGKVILGEGALDESMLTGESLPRDTGVGENVLAGSILLSGYMECEAAKVGEETALAAVVRLVNDATATKAPVAKAADRVAGVFVPAVLGIALAVLAAWLLSGAAIGYALTRAVSVLVVSCPCALGLATPVAIVVGSGVGARCGVLYKTAASLEAAGRITTVVFDKTGTVTTGKMRVAALLPASGVGENELLSLAAALEEKSEHPLGRAIVLRAKEAGCDVPPSEDFLAEAGGVSARVSGQVLFGGNRRYTEAKGVLLSGEEAALCERLSDEGKTPLIFARGGAFLGIIALSDTVKDDAKAAIGRLSREGIRTVLLTGDNERTANAVAREVGITEVIAGVLPENKAKTVEALMREGKVAMVGDGVNDAPALAVADLGIAIGSGTDIAAETADAVLLSPGLSGVPAALYIGRKTLRNVRENLFWAFLYNAIGIPLAAGALIPAFGLALPPMFGAAAMSLSSFCVVTNALRLNLLHPFGRSEEKMTDEKTNPININVERKEKTMTKTVKIEGMMCPHCEKRVKDALEALDGVLSCDASHERGDAILTLAKDVSDEAIRKTVGDAGYKVL